MTSRPILFSAPMVRALLAGTKTQTRRVVKSESLQSSMTPLEILGALSPRMLKEATRLCPYGQPGDCLWVKETHRFDGLDPKIAIANRDADSVQFRADEDDEFVTWRPSIFMPRWASRLELELTEVRVERLHAITEADALAEGVAPAVTLGYYNILAEGGQNFQVVEGFVGGIPKPGDEWQGLRVEHVQHIPAKQVGTARDAYRRLWEDINGPGSWALNPYVWALTFRRITP